MAERIAASRTGGRTNGDCTARRRRESRPFRCGPFLSPIEARRNQAGLRDRYFEALADYHRRRAALERAVSGPLTPPAPLPPR
jgi:hypothetical protein